MIGYSKSIDALRREVRILKEDAGDFKLKKIDLPPETSRTLM